MNLQPDTDINLKESRNRKRGFHPKLLLKGFQDKLQRSPYLYLIFCFLAPIVIMYGIYIVKGIYPFYNGSPLVLDLNAQYVSFFEALRDFALGERSILYSFSRSLGGEFMGMVAYYMASPFTYITVLFPKDRIQEAVLLIMLLKCGLSGLSFGFYLHKKSKNPKKIAIFIFSMLYALSAYAVVQQHNTMWIDALVWLPLFVYGLENLIYRRKYKLYVISLSVIMICNYYIGFMVCIFAVLYFFYYYFSKPKEEINQFGEKLHFIRTGGRFALFSLLSAAISAFMLLAAFYSLQFGKTEFSSPNWNMAANFDIVDFLTKFLPGAYDTVEPSGLPFVYCGLLSVILLPVYFLSKKITTREKIASLAILGVLILSLFLKPLDLIWHGFSMPNWLNSRYSFLFIFILLILAYKAFGNLSSIGEKAILCITAFIVFFAAVAEKFELESYLPSDKKLLGLGCVWFAIAFAIILAALLCVKLKVKSKRHTRAISIALAAVICVELFCNGIVCFLQMHQDVAFTSYSSYNNHLAELRPVVSEIKERDDSFYRMEKVRHRTKNDNMALGIYGLTNSTSTLNQKAISFVDKLGYTARSHYTMYNGGTVVGDSLLGIKYVIDYESSRKFDNVYNRIDDIVDKKYCVYENPNALSLAYGVSEDLKEFTLDDYDSFFNRYNGLLSAMLGAGEDEISLFKHVNDMSITSISCNETKRLTYTKFTTEENEGTVILDYVAPETGYYYFYANGSSSDELKINFNNSGDINYLGKDSDVIVLGGYILEGEYISITFTIPEESDFTLHTGYNFLWYFSIEDYNEVFSALKAQPQFVIFDESTEDNLIGTISTESDGQMILTTIPYDEGWNVYLDGERLETYETLDALLAFDIPEEGLHELELKYMPSIYKVGFIISICGISAFILLCAIDFVLKKTLLKNRLRTYEKDYFILADFDGENDVQDDEPLESNRAGLDTPPQENNQSDGEQENKSSSPSDDDKAE